jgi:flagellar biosynthesis chaperone FliJ
MLQLQYNNIILHHKQFTYRQFHTYNDYLSVLENEISNYSSAINVMEGIFFSLLNAIIVVPVIA